MPLSNSYQPELPPAPPRLFRADSAAQSFGVYLPAMIVYRGLGLVRGVLLAWVMPQVEFGLFQVALVAANILTPLCSLGLYEGLTRYVPLYETRGTLRAYLRRVLPIVLALAVTLSLVICIAARPLGRFLFAARQAGESTPDSGQVLLTCLIGTSVLAVALYLVLLAILKGLRMFAAVSLLELLTNASFTLLALVLAIVGLGSAKTMMICYAGTAAAAIPLLGGPLWRRIRCDAAQKQAFPSSMRGREPLVQLVRFSAWAALAAVMWQTLQSYPLWYLQKVHGAADTAVFAAVRHITQAVLIVALAVVTVVSTNVTKAWEAAGRAEAERRLQLGFKSTAVLLTLGCIALAAVAPWVIRLLPGSYAAGADILALLLLFFLLCGHLSFLSIHFNLIEKSRFLFWPWTVGVVCNIVLAGWLVRPGLTADSALRAAAWSAVLSAAAAMLTCLALLRSERRPIDLGSYLLIALGFALVLPRWPMVAAGCVLLVLAVVTPWLLTRQERHALRSRWR